MVELSEELRDHRPQKGGGWQGLLELIRSKAQLGSWTWVLAQQEQAAPGLCPVRF